MHELSSGWNPFIFLIIGIILISIFNIIFPSKKPKKKISNGFELFWIIGIYATMILMYMDPDFKALSNLDKLHHAFLTMLLWPVYLIVFVLKKWG